MTEVLPAMVFFMTLKLPLISYDSLLGGIARKMTTYLYWKREHG